MISETFPSRVILTDDPLRAKMLCTHHLEYSTLAYEMGDVLIFSGSYKDVPIALASTGFGSGAVLSFFGEIKRLSVVEAVYIGGCAFSVGQPTKSRLNLRAVVLAAGGSRSLSSRALKAAKLYDLPVSAGAVISADRVNPDENCVIDDITVALYDRAHTLDVGALSVLTLSENIKTGEKIEEHEKRSRYYTASRLVFETLALKQ